MLEEAALENLACESKPYEYKVYRYAYRQSRKERQGGAYKTFEYGYQSGLHTHVYEMAQGESQTFLGIRVASECEVA